MKRLIEGAKYHPDDHSHDHQDPDLAKAAIIDGDLIQGKLARAGDALADRLRAVIPSAPELDQWKNAKRVRH